MAISRRKFLGVSATAAASVVLPWKFGAKDAYAVANSANLTKWIQPLRGLNAGHVLNPLGITSSAALHDPNGITVMAGVPDPVFANTMLYEVTAAQFTDQLHPMLGPTTIWGYCDTTNPVKKHLGGAIINFRKTASRLRITNTLPATAILPIDTTIPGADPTAAPNRIATHLHGGYVPWMSDGGPFDWWTPTGGSGLSFQNGPASVLDNIPTKLMAAGQADYFYPNDQSTRLMWYHDHAFGITRINAYAGLATGYVVLDPAQESALGTMVPPIASLIPIVWQDKVFVNPATINVTDPTWATIMPGMTGSGSLWYEHVYDPKLFKLKTGKAFLPPPNPSCIPEFFGDTMLCNGTVYPKLTVEPKRYRFMMLNACNARFLNINLLEVAPGAEILTDPKTLMPVVGTLPGPPMIQIGTEGGYLVKEVVHPNNLFFNPATMTGNMLLGCAERSDFIIDFTNLAGKEYIMYNDAPGPFPAGPPANDYFLGNPKNPVQPLANTGPDTRQLLRIVVGPLVGAADPQPPFAFPATMPREPWLVPYPANPVAPVAPLPLPPLGTYVTRNLTLNEDFDLYGRLRQIVGTTTPVLNKNGNAIFGREYLAPATETPTAGALEVWNVYNLTADTHPMHFHLVELQIMSRQTFKIVNGLFSPTGVARGPELDELGYKETVKMNPGEVTTFIARFNLPPVPFDVPASARTGGNEYVYHCHILEHEEHDMMRPLVVSGANPKTPLALNPATTTVNGYLGGVSTFFINSGTAPYLVSSNNGAVAVALAALNGNWRFDATVAAQAAPGTATLTVTDAAGAVATATMSIFGIAPYAASVSSAIGGTAAFTIGGGTAPYTIVSSDPVNYPATPTATGFTVTVPIGAVVGTIVTFTVSDAAVPARTAIATLTIIA